MPRRSITVHGRNYVFSPDDPLALGARLWALVRTRVIDELTGQAPRVTITVESDLPGTAARVASDGLVGIVGIPHQIFPPLARQNYTVRLTVQADGYVTHRAAVSIATNQRSIAVPAPALHATVMTLNNATRLGPGELLLVGPPGSPLTTVQIRALGPGPNQVTFTPGLPHVYMVGDPVVPVVPSNFAPTAVSDLTLHRQATVIYGRVVQANAGLATPLPGATLAVTGLWRRPPPANMAIPAAPPHIVSLQPPLYFDRPAGIGRLRRRNLLPVPDIPSQEKRLLVDVPAGARTLQVSNRLGVNPTDIVLIDATAPELREFIAISAVASASHPAQPATLTLAHPLAQAHRQQVLIQRVTPLALGPERQLVQGAIMGDTTVFVDDLTGLTTGSVVQITGAPHPTEYHRLQLFATTSDAEGYYRLPPVSRVAQLEIGAEHGVLMPVQREFRPDYSQRQDRLDIIFR